MTRVINRMDKILLFLSIIMFIFGLFMILDASSMKSFMEYGNNTTFFNKQLIILMISMVISVVIILFPMKIYKRFIFPITIAIMVMLSIKWIGILLINSMLILPAASSKNISKNMRTYHMFSILFALVSGISGLILSYYINIPTSSIIVIISGCIYFITFATKKMLKN